MAPRRAAGAAKARATSRSRRKRKVSRTTALAGSETATRRTSPFSLTGRASISQAAVASNRPESRAGGAFPAKSTKGSLACLARARVITSSATAPASTRAVPSGMVRFSWSASADLNWSSVMAPWASRSSPSFSIKEPSARWRKWEFRKISSPFLRAT